MADSLFKNGETNDAPAYKVLARKYRPVTFDELIGQEAMVKTLSNAITQGRLPHAWMLTGVRGIGKTTTARIIARALNCTGVDGKGGPTVHPCGQCESCRAILEDRHVDILEMDAASRTGVEDIRDIIEGVRYGPVSARYKIYILDEVHMLSKNAFNALLKTLEEPPPHTKFIFATTEIRKVPVTVLSRCQRFDLRRIDSAVLAEHFAKVAEKEGAQTDSDAMTMIAAAADGSVRDGLSLLDQAIARGNGAVSADDVKAMLGLADRGQTVALCRDVLRGAMGEALKTFEAMQAVGADPVQVLQDLCDSVHILTRAQVVPDFAANASLPEYDRNLLADLADIKIPALARAWQILLKGIGEVQMAPRPAQAAEMVLIRVAYASELPLPGDLIKQLRNGKGLESNAAPNTPPSGGGGGVKLALGGGGVVSAPVVDIEPALELKACVASYPDAVALFAENREAGLHAQLYGRVHLVRFEPGLLELRVGDDAPANLAGRVGKLLSEWTGQRWVVSLSSKEGDPTLHEQDQAKQAQRYARAKEHPLVKAVFETFPGATLVDLKKTANELASMDVAVLSDDEEIDQDSED
ncbi:MAG: DNA polymerase III subunit gamma/tau [Alphaproteobacteria bacterium]|nr:DNA polymerase III subunit gamma/tau [Alphaproteobacteria bacterium]